MKKIIYILPFVLSILAFQSCLFSEDENFDDSAANRMNKTLSEYRNILASAPNGWLMEYYAESEPKVIGSYNFICYFDQNGSVTLAADHEIADILPAKEEISGYDLIADAGPVLTFNTYNKLLHFYTQPHGSSDVNGYDGDFEFMIMEVSQDKIVMHGKKKKLKVVMTRIDIAVDNSVYLKNINDLLLASTNMPSYKLIINGSEVATGAIDEFSRAFTFNNIGESIRENLVYQSNTNARFTSPVTFDGVTFNNFTWDSNLGYSGGFVCADENVDVKLITYKPEYFNDYNDYLGTYTLTYINHDSVVVNKTVKFEELSFNKTYSITGFFPTAINEGKLTVEYAKIDNGKITLSIPHSLPATSSTLVSAGLFFWVGPGSGSYYPTAIGSYSGTMINNSGDKIIAFKQILGAGAGLMFIQYNATGGASRYSVETSYNTIVFTKQ